MPKIKGFYYETTSLFNGAPIVIILTGFAKTYNRKLTRDSVMIQSWILDARSNPISTSKARKDYSICGDCKQRRSLKNGKCYVTLMHGPRSVFAAYKRGLYTKLDLNNIEHMAMFKDKNMRFGSYGDPLAVDINLWNALLKYTKKHTGYTHSFKRSWAAPYKNFLMASVDNEQEAQDAKQMGWRYFRTRTYNEPLIKNEFICPASNEANKRLTCDQCFACNGSTKSSAANPVIILHGVKAPKQKFEV